MEQIDLLRYVMETLERLEIPYMLVGSVSSGIYGEPRMTRDLDIVIQMKADDVDGILAAFPPEDFYVSRDAALDAVKRKSQFNVVHPTSGNKIDFMIARDDAWGKTQMERRRPVRVLPDLEGFIAAPEDVIIGKLLYYLEGGSEKHLRDIKGILKISSELIDFAYLARWTENLDLSEIWHEISSAG